MKCSYECETCSSNKNCYSCNEGFYLNSATNSCLQASNCPNNQVPNPNNNQCTLCGNGIINPGEFCDDGNLIDKDGCSNCNVDYPLYVCDGNSPSSC